MGRRISVAIRLSEKKASLRTLRRGGLYRNVSAAYVDTRTYKSRPSRHIRDTFTRFNTSTERYVRAVVKRITAGSPKAFTANVLHMQHEVEHDVER